MIEEMRELNDIRNLLAQGEAQIRFASNSPARAQKQIQALRLIVASRIVKELYGSS
jgi:hypothetical protein